MYPHKLRIDAHKVDYLRAISESMDYPFQSEDGRDPSPAHQALEIKIKTYNPLNIGNLQTAVQTLYKLLFMLFVKEETRL